MRYQINILIVILILTASTASVAQNDYSIKIDPSNGNRFFTFKSDKGAVIFNHDLHQDIMKTDSCIPCHKTKTPTKGHTMTRFDQRYAHAFCKGCHKDKGKGPTECHECHKETRRR